MYQSCRVVHHGVCKSQTEAVGAPPFSNGSEVSYPVDDHIASSRPTMNASWPLYLVLTIQPALILAAYIATRFFYQTPIDNGFGMIAILAGVRQEIFRLLGRHH